MRYDRDFRVWDYNVSHDQLLIRSPKTPDRPTNIDIVFVGVRYMDIPTHFQCLEVSEGESLPENTRAYTLFDGQGQHRIEAVAMTVLENKLDYVQSSLELF